MKCVGICVGLAVAAAAGPPPSAWVALTGRGGWVEHKHLSTSRNGPQVAHAQFKNTTAAPKVWGLNVSLQSLDDPGLRGLWALGGYRASLTTCETYVDPDDTADILAPGQSLEVQQPLTPIDAPACNMRVPDPLPPGKYQLVLQALSATPGSTRGTSESSDVTVVTFTVVP